MSSGHSRADIQEDTDIHSCQECFDTQTDIRGHQRTHQYLREFTTAKKSIIPAPLRYVNIKR